MGGCAGTLKQPNKPQQPFTPIYNTKPANNNVQPVRQI